MSPLSTPLAKAVIIDTPSEQAYRSSTKQSDIYKNLTKHKLIGHLENNTLLRLRSKNKANYNKCRRKDLQYNEYTFYFNVTYANCTGHFVYNFLHRLSHIRSTTGITNHYPLTPSAPRARSAFDDHEASLS